MGKIYNSVTELVGKTPMVRLQRLRKKLGFKAEILAKCEFYNPLFSIKDRAALGIIEDLEKSGKISSDAVLVEATSGNFGIALAAICASKGHKLVLTMPENTPESRIGMVKFFGADVILTDADDGMKGAMKKAEFLAQKNEKAIYLKQFENPANPDAHRFGTSIEIIDDTGGEADAVVVGVMTAGTVNGIASTLKTHNQELFVVAVDLNMPSDVNAKFYDKKLVNEVIKVSNEEALDTVKEVAAVEGLPIGIASGASLCAAIKLAKRPEFEGKNIVVILPDIIERELSFKNLS